MRKIIVLMVLGILSFGCLGQEPVVSPGGRSGDFCDAATPCPEGYECYKFEDEDTPICWDTDFDPCSTCPSGNCMFLESYPVQIRCIEEPVCEDRCGDGICQEIVCMAIGCPCAETPETCPEDCGS